VPRRRNPAISQGRDGLWHAWVTVGTKPNGRPDQRHIKRGSATEVEERVDELLSQVRAGAVVKPGRLPTLEQWIEVYLETVAPRRCDPTTIVDYWSKMRTWVIPMVGKNRLDRLTPEHLDTVYLRMARAGKADSTILKAHRILSRALEIAYRRSLVGRNVAKLIDAPTVKSIEVAPLTEAEALSVLAAAEVMQRRNRARWSVCLALGLRQGEALGLRWDYVDLEERVIRVWWQLHHRAFMHGCGGTCGRKRGGNCPDRTLPLRSGELVLRDGLILKEPKGKSRRTIPVPVELVASLKAQREIQDLEKVMAGAAYEDRGLVFATPTGGPIDPSIDHADWKDLLRIGHVRGTRLHDGRHTAATLLLAQGVKAEVVQEILGHSDIRITRGYIHVASEMARDATDRMGKSLLRRPDAP